jgi:hypothetical protein
MRGARLRRGAKRVALLLADRASGVNFAPFVALGEESHRHWQGLFERARTPGLGPEELRGLTSDWAGGLLVHLRRGLRYARSRVKRLERRAGRSTACYVVSGAAAGVAARCCRTRCR